MHTVEPFILAFLGGLIPVLLWLWFLEHEDKHPEPKRLVLFSFLGGMAGVIAVIPLEKFAADIAPDTVTMILMWAAIEELMKYAVAYLLALRRLDNDEPIDSLMYMIAAALGFSALENALFIVHPLLQGHAAEAIITGNFRFIGATLLHTASSSIVGLALSFSFYKNRSQKRMYAVTGLIVAVVLHTCFNLSIILSDGSKTMLAFYTAWIALVVILLLIEKVKQISNN